MDFRIIDWDNITQADFIEYLRQYSNGKRIEQSNVVVKTNLPLLGITMGNLRMIANQIKKGDYLKYLSHNWLDYYDLTIIYSLLLDEIDDYDLFEKYFMKLSKKADSWATVDSIPSKQLRKKH